MKISFGMEIARSGQKAAPGMSPVADSRSGGGLWRRIIEPFAGAWQKNIEVPVGELLQYPTLYACLFRISTDIGKLRFMLLEQLANGIWQITKNSAYDPVLRKPNGFQTPQQFRESWILSKLIQGNTYGLKRRDARGVVIQIYVLDPNRCQPMVTESGAVWYQLQTDTLNNVPPFGEGRLLVPASEIIHDRCITLHHPLIGVPPLAAAYWPAVKNLKLLISATEFFANNAQPGGILSAPAGMSEDDAKKVAAYWDENYTGDNVGRIAVIGADMKFTSFAMKGTDAQLIEQMKYSDEQICQPFGIPPFKLGIGSIPAGMKVSDLNQLYYSDALQGHIEHMEALLTEGLGITPPLTVELDLEPLLRMDVSAQADVETKLVTGKLKTPDEGRARFNLPPIAGGNTLWGQHQDYPLGVLASRKDVNPDPAATAKPPAAPADPNEGDDPGPDQTDKAIALLWKRSPESYSNHGHH